MRGRAVAEAACACVCVASPCVTVAVRAEPHDPVFVGDSETVKGVCSHHQEEVKHLRERIKDKRTEVSGHQQYITKGIRDIQIYAEKNVPPYL